MAWGGRSADRRLPRDPLKPAFKSGALIRRAAASTSHRLQDTFLLEPADFLPGRLKASVLARPTGEGVTQKCWSRREGRSALLSFGVKCQFDIGNTFGDQRLPKGSGAPGLP